MRNTDNLIPLTIKGAEVTRIGIELKEDGSIPIVGVDVQLLLENGASLTSIQISNSSWTNEEKRLEFDIDVLELIAKLQKALKPYVHRTLNKQQKILDHVG